MGPDFLTLAEVLEIHRDQIERYGGDSGTRDRGLLESAVAMPAAGVRGQYLHGDLFEAGKGRDFRPGSDTDKDPPGTVLFARDFDSMRIEESGWALLIDHRHFLEHLHRLLLADKLEVLLDPLERLQDSRLRISSQFHLIEFIEQVPVFRHPQQRGDD